jgi:hypothetical protein
MALWPWELSQGSAPWQQTAPLYPRTVTIQRPVTSNDSGTPQLGSIGYSGLSETPDSTGSGGMTTILTDVPCKMRADIGKVTALGVLPSDGPGPIKWTISIQAGVVAKGTIREHDVAADDEGYRYLISSAAWSPLGWKLASIRLDT